MAVGNLSLSSQALLLIPHRDTCCPVLVPPHYQAETRRPRPITLAENTPEGKAPGELGSPNASICVSS